VKAQSFFKEKMIEAGKDSGAVAAESRSLAWNWQKIAPTVGVWSALGLLFTPQTFLVNLHSPTPLNWWQAFVSTMFPFMLWALLTPPIFRVCDRFPLENRQIFRRVGLHFLMSILFGIAHLFLMEYGERMLLPWAENYSPPIPATALILNFLANNIMFYWGILAVNHAINYFQKYQDREFRLVEARMQALKTQLNPHFLFNTLNAISELVYISPPAADKTITELSDLLRITLEKDDAQEISLKDEIEFVGKYLNIQQTLLGERLKVEMSIEPETFDALVPNMFLQPLVENAVRHGIAPRKSGGMLSLAARRKNDRLAIIVEDDGTGLNANWLANGGIGLANTRARLAHLYGENYRFDIEKSELAGTRVTIEIPFREQSRQEKNF